MKQRELEVFKPYVDAWSASNADFSGGATETKALYADWMDWCAKYEMLGDDGGAVPFITQNRFVRLLQRLYNVFPYLSKNRYCLNRISLNTGAGQVVKARREEAERRTAERLRMALKPTKHPVTDDVEDLPFD